MGKREGMVNMSDTPRTDAAREATYIPKYEYVGAEAEAWEFAKKLEREINRLREGIAQCLEENGHLADGDSCTLYGLKCLIQHSPLD